MDKEKNTDKVESIDPGVPDEQVTALPEETMKSIDKQIENVGGEFTPPEGYDGSLGRTMFDGPSSNDGSVTVLMPENNLEFFPRQSLVRIKSVGDNRNYLGIIVSGPFAEPNGLRADANILVSVNLQGALLVPPYHGRVQVELIGEELEDGSVVPPRRRPLPNSPAFILDAEETVRILNLKGKIRIGVLHGQDEVPIKVPHDKKSVLPRHIGILGTTGGGKSTTVGNLITQFADSDIATVIIDTEGEYTATDKEATEPNMVGALKRRGIDAKGISNTGVYVLKGRETSNPERKDVVPFSLSFSELSPYAVMEILDLTSAQQERYLKAWDATKLALSRLKIYPVTAEQKQEAIEVDELEKGYPGISLQHLYDAVWYIADKTDKAESPRLPQAAGFNNKHSQFKEVMNRQTFPGSVPSWRALQGALGRLNRLGLFDRSDSDAMDLNSIIQPGKVSIVDLSDVDSRQIINLTIAQLLRRIQTKQEDSYKKAVKSGKSPTPVMILIEEAHEFLSAERIRSMPVLFQQVARIARRGRKRWLGLGFITQLPQHLPDEVLGLINNWILHKINDSNVVNRLRKSIGGIDESMWNMLPRLAPGQAIVTFTSMSRPLLTSVDPSPCKLLMIE